MKIISFSYGQTNILTCPSCKFPVARIDDKLVILGQDTVTVNRGIIQPGTTGKWDKKTFVVSGRFRAWLQESVFNYWTIQFSDGEQAWLAEGYGIYSILKKADNIPEINARLLDGADPGDLRELEPSVQYVVEKNYKARKWETEGELFIPNPKLSAFNIVELSNGQRKTITCFQFGKEPIAAFDTIHTTFNELQLTNLRSSDYTGRTKDCRNCKQTFIIKTFPFAQSCACPSCGTHYSLHEDNEFHKSVGQSVTRLIYLPIGSTGTISGIQYEVIGYVEKEEAGDARAKWREYTLYNTTEGFAFLSEFNGHWTYLRETCNSPVLIKQSESELAWDARYFKLNHSYSYRVLKANGEFPYNIFDNQKTKVKEFIAPPNIWIQESDKEEGIKWYYGTYFTPKEIERSFSAALALPYRIGVGAAQPSGIPSTPKLVGATILFVILLAVIHTLIGFSKKEEILLDRAYNFSDSSDVVSVVTDKYVLDKRRSNLTLEIYAPVFNNWIELEATLVNAITGKEYSLEKGVEYYSGYSEGEHWSEGSTESKAYFTRVPAGTYFLQLQCTREHLLNNPIPHFSLLVRYDTTFNRNLFWALALFLLWPVIKMIIAYYTENARWNNE